MASQGEIALELHEVCLPALFTGGIFQPKIKSSLGSEWSHHLHNPPAYVYIGSSGLGPCAAGI